MERFLGQVHTSHGDMNWSPVVVQTRAFTRPVDPVAYDCVKIMLIREGSAILFSEFGERPTRVGDLVVLCAATLCGAVPEGEVTVSTAYVDTDYLMDQLAWRHAEHLADRYAAALMIERSFHFRAELMRLRPDIAARFGSLLDQIEHAQARHTDAFYQMQALFSGVLHLLAQLMPYSADGGPRMHGVPRGSSCQRTRYAPIRDEVIQIERRLEADLARRWTVTDMAEIVHLSPRHLSRLFGEALGRTPISYLSMLRAKAMTRLLRDTDATIAVAGEAVGWRSRSRAREAFVAAIGVTPKLYRQRFDGRETDT